MKIMIHTDAHFSLTSSIMNRINGYEYSERLDMLVNSFEWMYELASKLDVDLIVNGGDLCDSDVLLPEVGSALAKSLSYSDEYTPDKKEIHLVGNHEIRDKDGLHNSVALLSGHENFDVIRDVTYLESLDILFVPYVNDYDIVYKMNEDNKPKYIISHMTYAGEAYNKFVTFEGLDRERLYNFNDNLETIFNGHIHNKRVSSDRKYYQIGSLTGNSFSDSYAEGLPGVIVLDTETGDVESYTNPHSVLFYKLKASNIQDIQSTLDGIQKYLHPTNKLCLRIEVPLHLKDNMVDYLDDRSGKYNISSYRIRSVVDKTSMSMIEDGEVLDESIQSVESLSSYDNAYEALMEFTRLQVDKIPADLDDMESFLLKYVGGDAK